MTATTSDAPQRLAPLSTATLVRVGELLMVAVLGLLVALALLPTGESVEAQTISVDVYGPYGELVHVVLLLFGVGAAVLALALGRRVASRLGLVCGLLIAVWALASLIDAFVDTNPPHRTTMHGAVHISLAISGLVAQMLVALGFPVLLRHRLGRLPVAAVVTSVLVLAAGTFFAAHSPAMAGLSERLLFAGSALWMVTSVRLAARIAPFEGDEMVRRATPGRSPRRGPRATPPPPRRRPPGPWSRWPPAGVR